MTNRGSKTSKPLLSVDEAAIMLGQSRSSLYRAIERDDLPLPVFTINGRMRIARRSLERLIDGEAPFADHDHDRETAGANEAGESTGDAGDHLGNRAGHRRSWRSPGACGRLAR